MNLREAERRRLEALYNDFVVAMNRALANGDTSRAVYYMGRRDQTHDELQGVGARLPDVDDGLAD